MILENEFASKISRAALRRLSLALLVLGTATAALAQVVVYNSIPSPIVPDVFSEGPEAYLYSQIGDGLALSTGGGTLDQVTVILSSNACTSGGAYTGPGPDACVTDPNARFTLPITVNVYSVVTGSTLEGVAPAPAPGVLLATITQNFSLPYRPSSDFTDCPIAVGPKNPFGLPQWYDSSNGQCYYAYSVPITFNLASLNVTLPSQIIVGFQFNSTDYGPHPIGVTACNATVSGCFYDSLNVSTDNGGDGYALASGVYQHIGSFLDPNGVFFNYTSPANSCDAATAATGVFGDDSPCFTGFHPEIQVTTLGGNDTSFQVSYAANLNMGESNIDIANTGANGAPATGPGFGGSTGNICVNVYAVDPGEELISCCSCMITPDATANLGVVRDLISNTQTGAAVTSVTVKLYGTLPVAGAAPGTVTCNNSAAGGAYAGAAIANGMAAWGTTLHQLPSGSYATTERPFTSATLSTDELASLQGRCAGIIGNASGFGVCASCRAGALGASKLAQ